MPRYLTTSFICLLSCTASFGQKTPLSSELTQEEIVLKRTLCQKQLKQLQIYRVKSLDLYQKASAENKKALLFQLKTRLEKELTQTVFPAWYGTPWDFNGTSNKPGEGKIACGYFVSTTLKHIGYQVNRYQLAQQPSQRIITTFVKRSDIDISSRRSLEHVKKKLMKTGDGIYIVGLDTHVGFIVVNDGTITFIHSSYYKPNRQVVAEPYDSKNPLSDSKYRVIGKLFHDEMLIKWLNAEPYTIAQ